MSRNYLLTIAALAASAFFSNRAWAAEESVSDRNTVWKGVYTPAQAARGKTVYLSVCSRCHREDFSGYNDILRGDRFLERWREDNLSSLSARVRTMPPNAPGSLTETAYTDIIAYILQVNEFPSGPMDLKSEALPGIRVEGKNGPEPVPDFALVEVVGCLEKDSAGKWMVTNAGEPVRTRNPGRSSAEELKRAAVQQLGGFTFHILDVSSIEPDPHNGHKMRAKGFLMRKSGFDRLNITSLEMVSASCVK